MQLSKGIIEKLLLYVVVKAVEDLNGSGAQWGLMQMPFGNTSPIDIPIQISKQYYALMQVCNVAQGAY